MADEKITKAIKNADSSVSIETKQNDSESLRLIKDALIKAQNNSSFFYELVQAVKEKGKIDGERMKHGSK